MRFQIRGVWMGMAVLCGLLLLAGPGLAGTGNYQQGLEFGKSYQAEIAKNIQELEDLAEKNGRDEKVITAYAREMEALYAQILPEKIEWMKGVAKGSGIAYSDILVFNTADRLITGFVGECTTFMAHGTALADGKGSLIAKNRDLGFQTLIEIGLHQARTYPKGAAYKAAYIDIEQAEATYKFIGSRTAGRWGYGMGVNEHQVTVSDNDAPSRDKLDFKAGLHDNDLVRLVLERAKTARQGVDVIAELVGKYGQAWNGIMFEIGDPNDLWVVEITGHRWVAKQYKDTVAARSNQYQIEDDYDLAAPDLVSFAVSQGWVPEGTERINFRQVYSTDELYPSDNKLEQRKNQEKIYNAEMRYQRATELLTAQKGDIKAEDVMAMCRDHYNRYELPDGTVIEMDQIPFYSSKYADWTAYEWYTREPEQKTVPVPMYIRGVCGHDRGWGTTAASAILIARPDIPNELGLMLHAYCNPCQSAYLPFYAGITEVDYRYTTPQACLAFQSIINRAFTQYTLYHDVIREAFDPFEGHVLMQMPKIEKQFVELKSAGKADEATALLNDFVRDKCVQALSQVEAAQAKMTEKIYKKNRWSR